MISSSPASLDQVGVAHALMQTLGRGALTWAGSTSLARPPATPSRRCGIPLFPLNTVLFPGQPAAAEDFRATLPRHGRRLHEGKHPLRHLPDRKRQRSRAKQPLPTPSARSPPIGDWEMEQLGILMITAQGGRRFRIIETTTGPGNLLEASVELLAETGPTPATAGTRTSRSPAPPHCRRPRQRTHTGTASLR